MCFSRFLNCTNGTKSGKTSRKHFHWRIPNSYPNIYNELKKQYLTLFTITLKLLTSQQTTSRPTGVAYKYWQKWHILF